MSAVVHARDMSVVRGAATILDDITVEIHAGQVVGVIGRNGAGKSTLLSAIAGLVRPAGGALDVLGLEPWRQRDALTRRVAVQAQSAALIPTLTVAESLALFASIYERHRAVADVARLAGLTDVLDRRTAVLSGGEARRLQLAIALLPLADLVLLDEPTAAVDPAGRILVAAIVDRLSEEGRTVVLATHEMSEAEQWCDRVIVLDSGRIIADGQPAELIERHRSVANVTFRLDPGTDLALLHEVAAPGEARIVEDRLGFAVALSSGDTDATLRRLTFTRGLRARNIRIEHAGLGEFFFGESSEPSASHGESGHRQASYGDE